ncbi:unnamed protein product, partial [Auanema sp. JU1783]
KTGKLYFAFPGSLDLQQSGIKIDCGRVIPNVWYENGEWRNEKGKIQVSSLNKDHKAIEDVNLPQIRFDDDYYGNFSSEDYLISLALSHSATLGMPQFQMLQIISDSNHQLPLLAVFKTGEALAAKAMNATQSVWESTKEFFVGTIERGLMTIGGVTVFAVAIAVAVFIIKVRYMTPLNMSQVNAILPYDSEVYPLTTAEPTADNNIHQPVPAHILALKYPNIINFIPLAIPLVCAVNDENHSLPFVLINIYQKAIKALWDSGASISIIQYSVLRDQLLVRHSEIHPEKKVAMTANGSSMTFIGTIELPVIIGDITVDHVFHVIRDKDCPAHALLGMDFMHLLDQMGHSVTLKPSLKSLIVGKTIIPLVSPNEAIFHATGKSTPLRPVQTCTIGPCTTQEVELEMDKYLDNGEYAYMFQKKPNKGNISYPTTIFRSNAPITVKLFNKTSRPLVVNHRDVLAVASIVVPIEREELVQDADYVPPEADWESRLPTFPRAFMNDLKLEGSDLNNTQKDQLRDIIHNNKDAFLNEDRKIGLFKGPIEHSIPLRTDMDFPRPRSYPIPLGKQDEVERQVREMLDQGIVEPSTSLFTSPVVLVKKKDDTFRFVTDFRALNTMTRKQTYIIPNIYDIISLAAGAKFFTTFDLVSGFFQIPLNKKDRHLTAFVTPSGVYQYCRMPMGLCGAPHTFQTAVRFLQSQVKCKLFVYLDDLLIISESREKHLRDIEEVLAIIAKFGLKIKLSKCTFASKEVKFLGIIIGREGVKTDPKKVEVINNFPVPKDVNALRSFLGMTNYFRRFIKKYAEISAPLYDLLKGKIKWCWEDCHQQCVDQLKLILTTAPVLKPPFGDRPFFIESDASNIALGCVLLQEHSDNSHPYPVAFASRKLVGPERRYPPIEIEALGIVFALQQFRTYVLGTKTTIITDHRPLTSLMKRRDLIGRLAKFQLIIQEYDVDIQYRPGKENSVPDALSRYIGDEVNHPKITKPKTKTSYVNSIMPVKEPTMTDLVKHTNILSIQTKNKWITETIKEFDKPMGERK